MIFPGEILTCSQGGLVYNSAAIKRRDDAIAELESKLDTAEQTLSTQKAWIQDAEKRIDEWRRLRDEAVVEQQGLASRLDQALGDLAGNAIVIRELTLERDQSVSRLDAMTNQALAEKTIGERPVATLRWLWKEGREADLFQALGDDDVLTNYIGEWLDATDVERQSPYSVDGWTSPITGKKYPPR